MIKFFSEKIENTYRKPIVFVEFLSILFMAEIALILFCNENLFEFIKNFKISYETSAFQLLLIFMFCFTTKIIASVIGTKIFEKNNKHKCENKNKTMKTIDEWLKIAYQENNLYSIEKLKNYEKSMNAEKDCYTEILLHLVLTSIYLILSRLKNTSLHIFVFSKGIFFLLGIYYLLLINILISLFSNKGIYLIDLTLPNKEK